VPAEPVDRVDGEAEAALQLAGRRRGAEVIDADDAAADADHIHVVVFHALPGGISVVAETGPDALHLVGGDAGADPAAADDDAPFGVPFEDGPGDGDSKIGVIVVGV